MLTKELKIPLSCRVNPDLKLELEGEAYNEGLTTSKYIERLLINRHEETAIDERLQQYEVDVARKVDLLNRLDKRIEELQITNDELSEENEMLKLKTEPPEAFVHSTDLFDFGENGMEEVTILIEKLRSIYPETEDNELVLASLHTQLKNEKATFFIHTLKAYFDKLEPQTSES